MTATTRHTFSSKRIACPRCKASRGFAPTIDDPSLGYCHACQTPIFGSNKQRQIAPPQRPQTERPQPPAPEIRYDGTDTLSKFLIGRWQGGEPMRIHLQQWAVGATLDGRTVFAHGNTTNKIMAYGPDGKRDKNTRPSWHPIGESVPLFGVQWLCEGTTLTDYQTWQRHTFTRSTPVFIVESEKTAIVASFVFPQYVWLACGGASGITQAKARALKDRNVAVLFDCDKAGSSGASKAVDVLTEAGAKAWALRLRDLIHDAPDGYDLGDLILEQLAEPLVYSEEYERLSIDWVEQWAH